MYMDEKIIKLGFAEISLLGITDFLTKKLHAPIDAFPTVSISKYFLLWLFGRLVRWELLLGWKLNSPLSGLLEACKVKFWTLWPITSNCGRGRNTEPGHKLCFHRKLDKRFMPREIKAKKVQEHFMWAHTFTGNVNSNIFKEDVWNTAEYFK